MLKNFIAEIIHATVELRTKLLCVSDKAYIKTLDVEKIVDNGSVYGSDGDIRELVYSPELKEGEKPGPGKNCNYSGSASKPSRADHTHHIPVPKHLKIFNHLNVNVLDYDTTGEESLKLTPDLSGAAKKMHSSETTEYGAGSDENFGHVKLCDDIDKSYDVTNGYAATPKAIKSLSELYLKLDGTSQMTGTIKTKGNSPTTPIDDMVPAIQIGTNSFITDIGLTDGFAVTGRNDKNIGVVSFGADKSTILLSKQNGHLYVRNDSDALRTKGYTIDGERMLVDYDIEAFFASDGEMTKTWTPARAGWYRIYVIGPGGAGAKGVATALASNTGWYVEGKSATKLTSYESDWEAAGFAIAGCGGGGGGVAVTDIFVPKAPYSYIGKKNGSITVIETNEEGDEVEVSETCYVESPVLKKATIQISKSKRFAKVSNLFAITGTTRRIDSNEAGDDGIEEVLDLTIEDSPIYAFGGFNAVAGSFKKTGYYTGKNGLSDKTTTNPDHPGVEYSPSYANYGKPIMKHWYGMLVVSEFIEPSTGKTIPAGSYYIRQGRRWDTKGVFASGSEPLMVWTCYSPTGEVLHEIVQGASNKQVNSFRWLIKQSEGFGVKSGEAVTKVYTDFAASYMVEVGPEIEVGRHLGLPVIAQEYYDNFSNSTVKLYQYYDITYSTPGLGGHATGGDVNYLGGDGDNHMYDPQYRTGQGAPLRRKTDPETDGEIACSEDSYYTEDHEGNSGGGHMVYVDGCCGGVPGEIGITGDYGANGGAGSIAQAPNYKYEYDMSDENEKNWKFVSTKESTIFARSGYGSGMCIAELGNYTGDGVPSKIPAKKGGTGKYGGGGGGGCAIVTKAKSGKGYTQVHGGGAGGSGCVLIAYFGDSKPKEQTNTSGIEEELDRNNDGIYDYLEVFLTYTEHEDGSVASLNYDPNITVVPLYDDSGELYEGGTGTITDSQRPIATPSKGYYGDPIYSPSSTSIDSSFSGNIKVQFAKDPSKWFNVTFVAEAGGSLQGTTVYSDILIDTPIVASGDGGVVIPTPVPNSGYAFDKWDVTIPATVTATGVYTAKFKKV